MITAKEARERIDAAEAKRRKQEKKTAEEKINAAVAKGISYCWLDASTSEATEEWLKSLGYKIIRTPPAKHCYDVEVRW